ncbi:MAG: hypothetical protein JNG88_13630 [Phycisphaerales bacterium]|nr:hypothetical protein [Phycisphaerales bacterium]
MCRFPIWKAGVFAAITGGIAYGTDFTWKASGLNHDWDSCGNWNYAGSPSPCYPADTGDDANIPKKVGGATWEVKIVDIDSVDVLTIADDVDFVPVSGTPCLLINKIIINPAISGSSDDVVVTVDANASIGTLCTN